MIAPFIGLVFGLLWLSVGAGALPTPFDWISGGIGIALAAIIAWRVIRRRGRPGQPFRRMPYIVSVVIELAAIAFAQSWLLAHGQSKMLFSVVGVIVGLHFIGLWLAFQRRVFLGLAAVMVAVNVAALVLPLPMSGRLALSGFGSAAALLISVAL